MTLILKEGRIDGSQTVSYSVTPQNGKSTTLESSLESTHAPSLQFYADRSCSCPPTHINCLTAKEWLKNQLGVWRFNYSGRDVRDKKLHPATFPISLAARVIELFTHKGELVLDPFVGSGTTLVAARDSSRSAVGFDLSEEYTHLSNSRLGLRLTGIEQTDQVAITADARDISNYLEHETVSLMFTSPPYANLLNRRRKNKSRRMRKNKQYLKVEQYSQASTFANN